MEFKALVLKKRKADGSPIYCHIAPDSITNPSFHYNGKPNLFPHDKTMTLLLEDHKPYASTNFLDELQAQHELIDCELIIKD